jgi:hypothetical protein
MPAVADQVAMVGIVPSGNSITTAPGPAVQVTSTHGRGRAIRWRARYSRAARRSQAVQLREPSALTRP